MQLQQLLDSGMQLVQDPDSGEFVWDAKGSRIIRVGDAKGDADAVNFRTVLVLIEQIQNGGGSVGIAPKFWSFEGDGEVTDSRWPALTCWTPCSTTLRWRRRQGPGTTWYRSPATSRFCLVARVWLRQFDSRRRQPMGSEAYHPARLCPALDR